MKKVVICNFNLFDMYHPIEVVDVEKGRALVITAATTDDLGRTIAEFCSVENVKDVQLIGSTKYAKDFLVDEIKTQASTNYGLNNLNITVRGV
jgi:hypothetical protein